MAKTTITTSATSATSTNASASRASQWAREKAKAIAEGNCGRAAFRFAKLADVLLAAEATGEKRITFAEANKRADLARGERGNPAASWRLALQRTRQLSTMVDNWHVDGESGALVYRD
jgi:hypothetical protein